MSVSRSCLTAGIWRHQTPKRFFVGVASLLSVMTVLTLGLGAQPSVPRSLLNRLARRAELAVSWAEFWFGDENDKRRRAAKLAKGSAFHVGDTWVVICQELGYVITIRSNVGGGLVGPVSQLERSDLYEHMSATAAADLYLETTGRNKLKTCGHESSERERESAVSRRSPTHIPNARVPLKCVDTLEFGAPVPLQLEFPVHRAEKPCRPVARGVQRFLTDSARTWARKTFPGEQGRLTAPSTLPFQYPRSFVLIEGGGAQGILVLDAEDGGSFVANKFLVGADAISRYGAAIRACNPIEEIW